MSVIRYFSPTTTEFDDAEFNNIPITQFSDSSINIIQELNKDVVNTEFDLRARLYETREAFHEGFSNVDTPDEEIAELRDTVIKGQLLLKNEILNYSNLKDRLEELENTKQTFHEQILKIKRSLMFINELDVEDINIKGDIEEIYQRFNVIDNGFKENINRKISAVNSDYMKSSQKLIQLKNVYQVLKNSDASYTCPICLNKQVEAFLIPCGHCLCNTCMSNTSNKCFMCRREFTKKCNLYFN